MLRLGMMVRNVATSPVAVGQELAAFRPKMICRRVDELGPSNSILICLLVIYDTNYLYVAHGFG